MDSRRTPFDVFDEMERAFDQMRRSMWGGHGPRNRDHDWDARSLPEAYEYGHDSNLSVEATDEGYVVLADLPGFEREEIDLRFDGGMLHISATHEVTDGEFARSRRVRESVSIDGDVRVDDIEATYRNGVLEIHVPTDAEAEDSHHIDID
ncbi:Hsp20/alpha crystallin family protein [Salinirubellus sp. GCM10025818]|jgi:HSP20 family protein|uniref:Hsp20/alpha crystallin family protein n=1 Tax=Salinirubellus TaxID=2162630 RepID=UPI0030CF59EC